MNLNQEIARHIEWIDTIASMLGDEEIRDEDLERITRHDECDLGRWLASEDSAAYRSLPQFDELVRNHEAFHQLAGSLITALQQGREDEALSSQARFLDMSKQVIGHLRALQASA